MKIWVLSAVLVVVAVCALGNRSTLGGAILGDAGQTSSQVQVVPVAEMSYFLPQVRLRKLHLVRPDLIPYPIDVEVVC